MGAPSGKGPNSTIIGGYWMGDHRLPYRQYMVTVFGVHGEQHRSSDPLHTRRPRICFDPVTARESGRGDALGLPEAYRVRSRLGSHSSPEKAPRRIPGVAPDLGNLERGPVGPRPGIEGGAEVPMYRPTGCRWFGSPPRTPYVTPIILNDQ